MECAICLENVGHNDFATLSGCIHMFCAKCVKPLSDTSKQATCPCCRTKSAVHVFEKLPKGMLPAPRMNQIYALLGFRYVLREPYTRPIHQNHVKLCDGCGGTDSCAFPLHAADTQFDFYDDPANCYVRFMCGMCRRFHIHSTHEEVARVIETSSHNLSTQDIVRCVATGDKSNLAHVIENMVLLKPEKGAFVTLESVIHFRTILADLADGLSLQTHELLTLFERLAAPKCCQYVYQNKYGTHNIISKWLNDSSLYKGDLAFLMMYYARSGVFSPLGYYDYEIYNEVNVLLQTRAYKRFLSPVPMAPVEKREDVEEELLIARNALEEAQQNMERVQKKFKVHCGI